MIAEKVIGIISEQFHVDPSTLSFETDLVKDLKADSLDMVELIMAFEDTFSLAIPDEVALSVHTIGDAVSYIEDVL